jgi:SAM-dependent methyltransferase
VSAREQFGRAARAYATAGLFAAGDDLALIVETARPMSADAALDVACGAGHVAFALAPHVARVVGVDITPRMLVEAHRLAAERGVTNLALACATADAIPLADAPFGIVACRYAAHHFPDITGALAEMRRLLADGGRLLVVDVVGPHDPTLAEWLRHIEVLRDPSHVRDYSLGEWMALLERAGFGVASVRTWKLPLEVDSWLRRMNTPARRAAEVRRLFATAPEEARRHFGIESVERLRFAFDVALFAAEPR